MQLSQKLKSMIYHIIVQYIVKKATGIRLVKKKFHDKLIMSDFFFSMTKILAGVTDYAIENLFQLDVINDFADKIGDFVGDIYQKLLSNLALTLFIIVCFNAFIILVYKVMQEKH